MKRIEFDQKLRGLVLNHLRAAQAPVLDTDAVGEALQTALAELEADGVHLHRQQRAEVLDELVNEIRIFGPLYELIFDPAVTEIMVNGVHSTFAERGGRYTQIPVSFADEEQVLGVANRLVDLNPGKRLDGASPMVDLSLPGGLRVNIAIEPVVVGGPYITIRKYSHGFTSFERMEELGTLDDRMSRFLWACAKARVNLLFSGAAGSGKTTLVEVVCRYVEPEERIITIEDTLELHFEQPNVARLLSRQANIEGKGEINIPDLFRNCLRMRPTRIILGELRGGEALDYLAALNSGHSGAMAIIHAARPEEALVRLEQLASQSPIGVPLEVLRRQISHGLNIVVQLEQLADGHRKVTRISEVGAVLPSGEIELREIFRFDTTGRDADGRVNGSFVASGYVPEVQRRIALAGLDMPEAVYLAG